MEEQLRTYLLTLAERLEQAGGPSPATVGKRAVNDTAVFTRLRERSGTFNIRTFDRLADWMADNWPAETPWPTDLPHPSQVRCLGQTAPNAA